jgi:hypothetical protein
VDKPDTSLNGVWLHKHLKTAKNNNFSFLEEVFKIDLTSKYWKGPPVPNLILKLYVFK